MIDIKAPFRERAEYVLSRTFRGLHHIDAHRIQWERPSYKYCEYSTYMELATFDSDELTRLVYFAHEACVRATVTYSGPRMVKIQMWPRDGREGSFSTCHPTIEQAIETMRAEG